MRIWMLASLLFAVTAIGGDRGIETSSRFSDAFVLLMECVPYAEASTPSSTIQGGTILEYGRVERCAAAVRPANNQSSERSAEALIHAVSASRVGSVISNGTPVSLLLHHERSIGHAITVADVPDSQLDEVAGSQLAVHT